MKSKSKPYKLQGTLAPNEFNARLSNAVLIHVFSFLNPKDLNNIGLVCQLWKTILNNDFTWKQAFTRKFGKSPLCKLAESWKMEYILRVEAIRSLEYGGCILSRLDSRLDSVSAIYLKQNSKNLLVGCINDATSCLLDIESNKYINQITFASDRRHPTCMLLEENVMAIGYLNGQIAFSFYTKGGLSFLPITNSHVALISVLASYKDDNNSILLSGAQDGKIIQWDLEKGRKVCNLEGMNNKIVHLVTNDTFMIALDDNRNLAFWKHQDIVNDTITPFHRFNIQSPLIGMKLINSNELIICTEKELIKYNLITLESTKLEFQFNCTCWDTNFNMPNFVVVGRLDGVISLFNLDTMEEIHCVKTSGGFNYLPLPLTSVLFDALKVIGVDTSGTLFIFEIITGRLIRKLKLWNFINTRFLPLNHLSIPIKLIKCTTTKIIIAIRNNIFVYSLGHRSVHLNNNKPKRPHKNGPKGSQHYATIEAIREENEYRNLKIKEYNKIKKLQDLDLSEEELITYAKFLSSENSSHNNSPFQVEQELDLSEDEQLRLAILLSKQNLDS